MSDSNGNVMVIPAKFVMENGTLSVASQGDLFEKLGFKDGDMVGFAKQGDIVVIVRAPE